MRVRSARPEDLPELERLKLAMGYPGSVFFDEATYFQTALCRLRDYVTAMQERPDWRLLVLVENGRPGGYLLFVLDDEHGVTHELQAHVLDFAVFSFEGLSTLVARARKIVSAVDNLYLLVDLAPKDKKLQLWFYRCGFRGEQQRVARRIPRGHHGLASPTYRIRSARTEDLPFIVEIHSLYSPAYRPAGRDVDLETLDLRYQLTYLALDLGAEGSFYLLMEEVSSGLPVGYVFLQEGAVFGGEKSLYVYDVAVAPAFANRGLSVYLRGAAETVAGQEGAILYGDGSLALPSLASWHAQMGYEVESTRFALDCRSC